MIAPNQTFIQRCLTLAKNGLGQTRSNPMVGAVLVQNGAIVAEGYHQRYGEAHAEVEAINAIADKSILKDCTLYVNLEPCSHFGKTPPCTDLILSSGIRKVVIGAMDPNPKVAGRGITKLRNAGCDVQVGVLENECRELNKRFYTFHQKHRPWIVLKWAQSQDGFISKEGVQTPISCHESLTLAHKWRAEEMAILIGRKTAAIDNPQLNVRLQQGTNPIRLVLDKELSLPSNLKLFDGTSETLIFSERTSSSIANAELITCSFDNTLTEQICFELQKRSVISCLIEGGNITLQKWIDRNLWDEARVFVSPTKLNSGVPAPKISKEEFRKDKIGSDSLYYYINN